MNAILLLSTVVPLLMPHQRAYLDLPRTERMARFADCNYRQEMASKKWYPETVRLNWNKTPGAGDYTLTVRREDASVFSIQETSNLSAEVGNLEIATKYIWEVSRGGRIVVSGTFETEDRAPRLLKIGGLHNTRDLGGYIGFGGRRIRQGMILRSGAFNDNAMKTYYTREELLASDTNGMRRAEVARLEKSIAGWTNADPRTVQIRAVDIGHDWTVVPKGKSPFKILTDDKGTHVFSFDTTDDLTLTAEFSSDEAGYAVLGASGDWFWDLKLNGERIADFSNGNDGDPGRAEEHPIPVRLRKGVNHLEAFLRHGTAGCVWSCRGLKPISAEKFVELATKRDQKLLKELFVVEKGLSRGKTFLDEEGRRYLLDVFGLKTEIDLRSDLECWGMTGSPVGETVRWVHISSTAYSGMRTKRAKQAFAKVFRLFTDRKNYGIDFHCIAGQDRTGTVSFLLLGLLGVEEEDLYKDWEATGFWNKSTSFCHAKAFDYLVGLMDTYEGQTLAERIYSYVKSCGITETEIDAFREIMLEPPGETHAASMRTEE